MKSFLLTIASILVSLAAYGEVAKSHETHKPLVVEGRTWWYESDNKTDDDPIDYGVTIGKEVDIDGVKWHEVRVIKTMLHSFEGVWYDCKDKDILVAYIREEGDKVYSMPLINHSFKPIHDLGMWINSDQPNGMLVYNFASPGNHFDFGNEGFNCLKTGFDITEVSEIQNSGNTYKVWIAYYDGIKDYDNPNWVHCIPLEPSFKYAEGIGITNTFNDSMLFYMPWAFGSGNPFRYHNPTLRYVTEGEDNTIIYEGIGGEKLWEKLASVDNVAVESTDSDTEWYTIQGLKVDRPTTPGVYIRRQGNTTKKVVIK